MARKSRNRKSSRRSARSNSSARTSKKVQARPLGVTVISIVNWLGAAAMIVGSLFLFAFGSLISFIPLVGILGSLGWLIGSFFLIIGLIQALVTIWLWNMEQRGWFWTMILNGLGFILSLMSFNLLGVIISAIIMGYLWANRGMFKIDLKEPFDISSMMKK